MILSKSHSGCICVTARNALAGLFVAVTRCKSRLTIVEIVPRHGSTELSVDATTAVKCAFNWMRRLGVGQHHPFAASAHIGRRDGATIEKNPADTIEFGSDESTIQHVADGCEMMCRVMESVDEEEETLREWVDNAVRGFKLGNRSDLADAAKSNLNVILARRKAAGEKNPHSCTQAHRS